MPVLGPANVQDGHLGQHRLDRFRGLLLNRLGCRLVKLDIWRLLINHVDRLDMNYCRLVGLDMWVSIISSNIRLD